MDYETIDIHDERAKELAQILMNDKAIAILHLVEDRALSISEISRELNLPISTVSYHVDKMLKVGLIEVAGKKYGKRLQEVKLYRASNRPILLVPRRNVAKVRKKAVMSFEKLHVISLGLAGLVAAGVYAAARNVLAPVNSGGTTESITKSAVDNVSMMVASERAIVPSATNTSTESMLHAIHSTVPSSGLETHATAVSVGLAIAAFILTFLLISYIMKRRS
ncbi:ArsR family transcriptional regulator [Thermococcus sp. 18S1]|uniref:ArsR/SmtB family transcription factor n=1 Tax=Thermococcus sp. 18S1 TaxID=1638210 RepID=UPI00143BA17E|nr:helix-turn-helix domain-containing protein [Thermococcus sp. 18S1]NJE31447.1 ArsR family transcriptional regulator [Thermococcus sp. 18S1]